MEGTNQHQQQRRRERGKLICQFFELHNYNESPLSPSLSYGSQIADLLPYISLHFAHSLSLLLILLFSLNFTERAQTLGGHFQCSNISNWSAVFVWFCFLVPARTPANAIYPYHIAYLIIFISIIIIIIIICNSNHSTISHVQSPAQSCSERSSLHSASIAYYLNYYYYSHLYTHLTRNFLVFVLLSLTLFARSRKVFVLSFLISFVIERDALDVRTSSAHRASLINDCAFPFMHNAYGTLHETNTGL